MLRALDEIRPDAVLIELPADCAAVLALGRRRRALIPPVALLGYLPSDVSRAAFWPLADFSPEWQAARWACASGVALTPIDIPMSWALAESNRPGLPDDADPRSDRALAAASGEPDAERWWEDVVEHRGDGAPAFAAIAAAMAAVRGRRHDAAKRRRPRGPHAHGDPGGARRCEATVAVVCGAWHVPALDPDSTTATADRAVLARGVRRPRRTGPRRRSPGCRGPIVGCSGAPATPPAWPHPGWYRHVFHHPGPQGVARFFVDAAAALRRHGLAASPDHLIAASRLADALAVIRGRPRSGLAEVLDAASAVPRPVVGRRRSAG